MAVYRFRVSFEEFDEIHRDIEIKSTQTFEHFHLAIQEAIGFDASKPASFFMSNDNWKKGQEITYRPDGSNHATGTHEMRKAVLCDYIADPHQKIYYIFDLPLHWTFFIELFKILPDDASKKYPTCVKSIGDAPKQYQIIESPKGVLDPDFIDDEMFAEVAVEEEEDVEAEVADETEVGFGEAVDEEEYDNIEETSEEEGEREE
ncbi:MAG: hypothetical protein IPP34_04355 [Bacteroidetes bacterium]|nr:hypothetical protein [Bacteroidota bacterium]